MSRRASPGEQLSAGRLRVDAARAIAKLREYQLADRTAWILEAIRAAVASGATRVLLRGDANDVWLCWDGEPWDPEALPRLFDELVNPEASGDHYAMRLLASAVNSALGLSPAYIDVFSVEGKGRARRARYLPEVLVPPSGELDESPLRRLAVVPAEPPLGAGRGMAIHLRRRLGLEVVSYFLRDEPPELALARQRCADLSVPIFIEEAELGRHLVGRDVLRVPLGADLDGFLAVIDAERAGVNWHLDVAERGVSLAAVPLHFPIERSPLATHPYGLPLRVFLDGPRMPTNASRSAVNHDAHPVSTALRRAAELVPELIRTLTETLAAALADPTPPPDLARMRAAALALLAGAGPRWTWEVAPALRALGELPLVRDATGAPRPVTRLWRPFVHTGRAWMPAELRPWLGDVLHVPPGDAASYLVPPASNDARAFRHHLRWARRELRTQQRFFAHAPRPARVAGGEPFRVRAALDAKVPGSCVPDEWFTGITGEVHLRFAAARDEGLDDAYHGAHADAYHDAHAEARGDEHRGAHGELTLLLEGRELEHLDFQSPIPFAAVLEVPGILPDNQYRSARRDDAFARADRAMRGAVVRAMEALALAEAGEPVPDGFTLGPSLPHVAHARSLRAALALVVELGLAPAGPLVTARGFGGFGGDGDRWYSLAELRERAIFGTAPPGALLSFPEGRLVIAASAREHATLERLAPVSVVVRYEPSRSRASLTPEQLAERQLNGGAAFALALRAGRTSAAIAPAEISSLHLHHHGVFLEQRPHAARLTRCRIFLDIDDAVPTSDWRGLREVGVTAEELETWERELVRAAALSFVGPRPAALRSIAEPTLDGALGLLLAEALRAQDPEELLGAELCAALRDAPIFSILGGGERSATQLAAAHPRSLPFVARASELGATPIDGSELEVLRADEPIARLAARLAGKRDVHDASAELTHRHERARRERALAAHRRAPAQPFALPEGVIGAELPVLVTRCLAGVTPGPQSTRALSLHIFVEGRRFRIVHFSGRMPLVAVIDLKESEIDGDFSRVNDAILRQLLVELERLAPRLVLEIARQLPAGFAEPGGPRALLAACLRAKILDEATRAALAALLVFPTLDGGSLALAAAPSPLRCATWDDEWLEVEALPAGQIVRIASGDPELRPLLAALLVGATERATERAIERAIVDVSERAAQLQGSRRVELGLVKRPTVPGVAPAMRRKLEELGEAGRALGPGEVALVADATSAALLHFKGELHTRLRLLDVQPSIYLAIEAPALVERLGARFAEPLPLGASLDPDGAQEQLTAQAQAVALELVRQIITATPADRLPHWVSRGLRRLLLSNQLTDELGELAIFQTSAGAAVPWRAIAEQIALFGDAWAIAEPSSASPLDPRRLVFLLAPEEQHLARRVRWPVLDASVELQLDGQARKNQARPRALSLALDPKLALLGAVTLDGDGETAPRGVVGVLAPQHIGRRGLRPHHRLLPLAPLDDLCVWPTIAVVDDARLLTDRTWQRAAPCSALSELVTAVEAASERVLAGLVRIPDEAIASLTITEATHSRLPSMRGSAAQLRGALWLDGPPGSSSIAVFEGGLQLAHVPAGDLGLRGALYVYIPLGDPAQLRLHAVLTELCNHVYSQLVHTLSARDELGADLEPVVDPDLIAAHVANALIHRVPIEPGTRMPIFGCFRPEPIGTAALINLLRTGTRISQVDPDAPDRPATAPSICDDGSAFARVLLPHLAAGPARESWWARPIPPLPPDLAFGDAGASSAPTGSSSSPAPSPAASSAPPSPFDEDPVDLVPTPPHPLAPLLTLLRHRIAAVGVPAPRFFLCEGDYPIATAEDSTLYLGSDHPRLLAIAATLAANTAWHTAAVDALSAHLVTLLNISLTSVTDATERHALAFLLEDA